MTTRIHCDGCGRPLDTCRVSTPDAHTVHGERLPRNTGGPGLRRS